MKLAIAFVLAVSATLASVGAYIGAHPSALSAASGLTVFDDLNRIAGKFGQASSAMLVVSPREGTILEHMEAFDALGHRLRTSGLCEAVVSFANLPRIVLEDDAAEMHDLVERAPKSPEEVKALELLVRANPNAVGELISSDMKHALVICPLTAKGSIEALEPLVHEPLDKVSIDAAFVGPLGLADALGDDLTFSAIFFVVLGLVMAIAERKRRRASAGVLLAAVLLQAALVYGAHAYLWKTPYTGLAAQLGPGAAKTQAMLHAVTGSDDLVLVEARGDFTKAAELQKLQGLCDSLAKDFVVSCPVNVLGTMAQALAGTAELPKTDEQLKALWFFGGDRPDFAMLFTRDKSAALVRVRVPDRSKLGALDEALKKSGVTYERGGIPIVETFMTSVRVYVWIGMVLLTVLAFFAGRAGNFDYYVLGEVLLAPALMVKVGLASRLLLALGLIVLAASIGARTKPR